MPLRLHQESFIRFMYFRKDGRETGLGLGSVKITQDYSSPIPPPDTELTTGRRTQRTERPAYRRRSKDELA